MGMDIVLTSAAFLIAAACVGVMGFAIQRGATCTVAAVDEVVSKRGFKRLAAFIEASVWVAGGLLVAHVLHLLPKMPAGYALTGWTLAGGALLGLGAFINRACVFGAIARFGSGEWAYLATPIGFYVGCLSAGPIFAAGTHARLPHGSPVLQAPAWVAVMFLLFVLWRLARPLWDKGSDGANASLMARARAAVTARIWSPHAATTIIGITFLIVLLLLGGTWAYTDVLAELARGMAGNLTGRVVLVLALLAGAVWGGWTAGRFRSARVTPAQVLRCFIGGILMAWGGLLIPGSNDGLILVGMPLLWPYAWVAFGVMCLAIAAASVVTKALAPRLANG